MLNRNKIDYKSIHQYKWSRENKYFKLDGSPTMEELISNIPRILHHKFCVVPYNHLACISENRKTSPWFIEGKAYNFHVKFSRRPLKVTVRGEDLTKITTRRLSKLMNEVYTVDDGGAGPVPGLLISEIFLGRIMAKAMAFCMSVHWVIKFMVRLLFLHLLELMGPQFLYSVFGMFCLMAVAFVKLNVMEMRGKSLREIEITLLPQD